MQLQCVTESETTANTASVGKQPGKTSTGVPGEIVRQANSPRSYLVETPNGQVHRNCSHNRVRSENIPDDLNGPNNLPDLSDTSRIIANRSHKGTAYDPQIVYLNPLERGNVV